MAKKEKKLYQDVLVILEKRSTRRAEHNSLATIEVQSEDRLLKEKIQAYRKNLIRLPEKATSAFWNSPKVVEVRKEIEKCRKELAEYCQNVLASNKPEWQIIAEQHGWKPPVSAANE